MKDLFKRDRDAEEYEEWDDRLFRVVGVSDYLKRSLVIGVVAIVAQFAVMQGLSISPHDRAGEALLAISIRCVGTGILFAWCAELAMQRPKCIVLFCVGTVACLALFLVAFMATFLASGPVSRKDEFIEKLFMRVAVYPFIYSLLGLVFGKLTGHRVPFGKPLLTAFWITIGYSMLTPWLAMFLREFAPSRPDIGNILVQCSSHFGDFAIVSFMMWFAIKCGDEEAARF